MVRATTPTLICSFDSALLDLSTVQNIYVTLSQGYLKLTKSGEDLEVEENNVKVYLTQSETLMFKTGEVSIQVNWTFGGGRRGASNIAKLIMKENLLSKVVE